MAQKCRIKRDDLVLVIAGEDKGKTGKVLRVDPEGHKVVVEGVRVVKRHQKPVGDRPGGIVHKEQAIDVSNVVLWNEAEKRRVRVAYKVAEDKKVRVDRKTGAEIQ